MPGRFLVHSADLIVVDVESLCLCVCLGVFVFLCVFVCFCVYICVSVWQGVTEVPGRFLVHSGDLIEVDAESLAVIQKVSLFLLSDSLMIALLMPHR